MFLVSCVKNVSRANVPVAKDLLIAWSRALPRGMEGSIDVAFIYITKEIAQGLKKRLKVEKKGRCSLLL